jgi:hypothetical protein
MIPPDLALYSLSSKQEVNEFEALSCPGYYYCNSLKRSTLSITVEPTFGNEEDRSYLNDFGQNLSSTTVHEMFDQWMSAGLLITISSGGGRPQGEVQTLICLALGVAHLTSGFVVVTESIAFGTPIGIYRITDFLSLDRTH